jgi:hypothetical protein
MADELTPAPTPIPAPRAAPPPPPEPEVFSKDYVRELRGENASYRTRATEAAQKAQEADERATKAEKDADEKITATQTAANERVIRAELRAVAVKAGMVDLDGLKLADMSTVKLDDNGEVEGADALMEALKKAKPYLFGATTTTTSTEPKPKPGDPEPLDAKKLTPEDYERQKRELLRTR